MRKSLKYLALFVFCTTSTFTAIAHSTNEKNPYIVHRLGIYEVAGGHMNALNAILMLGHPAKDDISYHAKAILEAFKHHGDAFPEGSDKGKTHAKKNIWTDPEGFKEKGKASGEAIMELIKVSETGDLKLIKTKFADVGKSCKSCHDDYRKKGS